MTKQTRNGRKQSCKTSCLACTFFSICELLLNKKRKKKRKKMLPFAKVFSLPNEVFFDFCESFYAKFVPKITIRESFCQKFRDFLISWKFLLAKVSAPKVFVRTYFYFWSSVRISSFYENLFETFLIVRIFFFYENSLLSVRIS